MFSHGPRKIRLSCMGPNWATGFNWKNSAWPRFQKLSDSVDSMGAPPPPMRRHWRVELGYRCPSRFGSNQLPSFKGPIFFCSFPQKQTHVGNDWKWELHTVLEQHPPVGRLFIRVFKGFSHPSQRRMLKPCRAGFHFGSDRFKLDGTGSAR